MHHIELMSDYEYYTQWALSIIWVSGALMSLIAFTFKAIKERRQL